MGLVRQLRLDLVPEPSSVREARGFIAQVLADWGLGHLVEDAALLTSELATNVVLHARTTYAVVVLRTTRGAQIDVLDRSPRVPELRSHTPGDAGGRGLAMVEGLGMHWGPTPQDELGDFAKGVRFEVC